MRRELRLVWILGVVLVAACSGPEPGSREIAEPAVVPGEDDGSPPLVIYVVNHPLEFIAQRLGGDEVTVRFPAPPEVDPAYWSPDPESVAAYQTADLVLLNGAGYAKWTQTAALPTAALVDTSTGFADRLIPIEEGTTHTHGPEGEHVHKGWTFTTWLDPTLAIEQARVTAEAIGEVRPELGVGVEGNLAELASLLESWDRRLMDVAATWGEAPVLFSHPVYQYFERRYGWNGRSVHWEPGQSPTEGEWRDLEILLAEHPARLMIWEGQPDPGTVDRLAALGVRSVVFSPGGNRPEGGDWGFVMEANVARLVRVVEDMPR